jgi:3-hydroxyacyl-CoA dehydrogenase
MSDTLTLEKTATNGSGVIKANRRVIKKVAVLGSGVMGSRIALHCANIGLEVLLLDIVPFDLKEEEKSNPKLRNRLVNDALAFALKTNPSPVYNKKVANKVKTGNFDDNMKDIADADWIIEVVVERLDIKKQVFEKVEKFRKAGTLITSNTSGIPIHMMTQGRSDDFRRHFCGTHFFNPPRYLKLLEIIPTPETDAEVVNFLMDYGDRFLGKTTVLCKDTPAFIANRIGVASIMALFHLVEKMDMTVEEVDKLTGPIMGRAKSATFRTCDVVGLDTLVHVANGLRDNCPNDEKHDLFTLPGYVSKMVENKWIGSKAGQGFFKQVKEGGKKEIFALDLKTLEYKPSKKVEFGTLKAARPIDDLRKRTKVLYAGTDKAGDFYRAIFHGNFEYCANRIPEISDELYRIDQALSTGFGWELGPFETWDALGVAEVVKNMEAAGNKPAQWVYDMLAAGVSSFYKSEGGKKYYYDIPTKSYKVVPGTESLIILDNIRKTNKVWGNSGTTLFDLGDGVLGLEFHTKMNSIGGEVIEGINKAIVTAENEGWKGLVIGNQGQNFSAGANVAMIFMLAVEQEWDELYFAIKAFQDTMMRVRYSSIPVVVAPHGMTLGGGCEINLHADKIVAAAETYIGLVEFGIGVIPAGGGTKEFALRASDAFTADGMLVDVLKERYLTIGMAKVATSAHEGYDLGMLVKGRDEIILNRDRQIALAKQRVLEMAPFYVKPVQRRDIKVLGRQALGMFQAGANSMVSGGYISEHDKKISEKLAYVMCGGDLSAPTEVSEQYLLELERQAFLSLCGEKKTLERMQGLLTSGKIIRN